MDKRQRALVILMAVVAMALVGPAVFAAADDWGFTGPVQSFGRTFAVVVGGGAALFGLIILGMDLFGSSGGEAKNKIFGFLLFGVGAGLIYNADLVISKFGSLGALVP